MSPDLRKELAQLEANKYLSLATDKVIIVMPFEAAWIDPSEDTMLSISDFAADRQASVHTFMVEKEKEVKKLTK